MIKPTVTIIGAGNLAWHLAIKFQEINYQIAQIYSKTYSHAKELATIVNASYTNTLSEIKNTSDIYIIAISDDSLINFCNNFNQKNNLILHTSGSHSMDILMSTSNNFGVLYPIQSFVKNKKINFKNIPICIEANSIENLEKINRIAIELSENVYKVNSNQRKSLHLAAVFACNFTNLMLTESYQILKENGMQLEILKPLIEETIQRIDQQNPFTFQTGPAIRENYEIIKKHLNELEKFPEQQKIYSLLTNRIINLKKSFNE